jgi:hypothetical protein
MIYYLYKITNILDRKIYIGVHKTKDLNDNYMGSGKLIKRAIKKHGIENFSKEIIEYFNDEESMLFKEQQIVNGTFVSSDETYNIVEGGHGSFSYINSLPNQGHKPGQQKAASVIGKQAFLTKIKTDSKFRKTFRETISKVAKTKHAANNNSIGTKGHKWISNNNEKTSLCVSSDTLPLMLSRGWYLGRRYNHNNIGKKYKKRI